MQDPDALTGEIAALRQENQELDDQVKLLVQAEQRLYRLKAEIDRQLDRVRGLADFALESARAESGREILRRAAALLDETFDLDEVCAASVWGDPHRLHLFVSGERGIEEHERGAPAPELIALLAAWDGPRLLPLDDAAAVADLAPLLAATEDTPGRDAAPGGVVAYLPLRDASGAIQAFLFLRSQAGARRSFFRAPFRDVDLPFLTLLGRHVERALHHADLVSRLQARELDLADVGAQLEASSERIARVEEKLVQAQRMEAVGRLAGGVAHDFNNLLTVVLSHAELLESELPPGSPARADALSISEAAARAAKISNQLLAFSRRQRRAPEVVDLSVLVTHMMQLLDRLLGEHVSIELRTDPTAGCVRADPGQLEQIVLNLAVHAREGMPSEGALILETRTARPADHPDWESRVVLAVTDPTGGAGPATGRDDEGHLALAAAERLVSQNEGHLAVAHQPGRGLVFAASFPIVTDLPEPTTAARPSGDGRTRTILLVEDDAGIRRVTARILRRAGYEVIDAQDGEHARQLAGEDGVEIDLLLTDVVMPRLGGRELADRLRDLHPRLRVLFMSGYAYDDENAEAPGAWIQKPFTPDTLLQEIEAVLSEAGTTGT